MKKHPIPIAKSLTVLFLISFLGLAFANDPKTAPEAKKTEPVIKKQDKIPLKIQLPKVHPVGTVKNIKSGNLPRGADPRRIPKRAPFLVPKGVRKISHKKPVVASDELPVIGEVGWVTDGDKEGTDGSFVEFGPGLQYVQIDLGAPHRMHAVVFWHVNSDPRVYRDVIVRTSDDPDFILNVKTLFNNDHDNSSGLGRGKDKEYFEDHQGKLVDMKGVRSRYVRLYSNGNTSNEFNHYTEVEVYGLSAE